MAIKKSSQPTMRQIGYLSELEKLGDGSGQVMRVARKCDTDHGAVSRFFKTCCGNGVLTEDYRLTEYGENWLHGMQALIAELKAYLQDTGLSGREVEAACAAMVETVEPHVLKMILAGKKQMSVAQSRGNVRISLNETVQNRTRIRVGYCFYRTEGEYTRARFSMANGGFEKEAHLCWVSGKAYLELAICEMTAHSRIDGREMKGYLRTLKYNESGIMREAAQKDGHVLLPLSACHLWHGQNGVIRGTLFVTVTCSVGDAHMPESTAALVFWV